MLNIFGPGYVVGLEITDSALRAVELAGRGDGPKLINYGERELPAGIVKEGVVADKNTLGKEISALWSSCKFKGREVVIGLSNQEILVRFATFPRVEEKKLDNIIRFQAQEALPLDIDSLVFDYSVTGEVIEDNTPMWEVLLVAGKTEMIYEFVDALELAGLKTMEVEVLPLTLTRLLNEQQSNQLVAAVDVTRGINNLLIVDRGLPRLARIIPPIGSEVTESLLEAAAVSETEGSAGTEEFDESNQVEYLVNTIRMSLDFYESQSQGGSVENIVLSGKACEFKTLISMLKDELGLTVELVDPVSALNINDEARKLPSNACIFAQGASLAHKGLEVM